MSDVVSSLLQWLNAHPQLAGLVTFIISAGESVAIIGTIVPGSIMMTALGTLAGAGVIPLWETIIWAILGAIVGDGISYWIGYHFKARLPTIWPFYKYPGFLLNGERFFLKYGSMSVFIGRFVGPVRALVPLVAGMFGMRPLKFIAANVTSAIGWAPAYMLPGILLGAASLELPPDIAIHVILGFLLLTLFLMLCLWFIYKLFQLISNQTRQLQIWIWNRLDSSRYLHPLTYLLEHQDQRPTGQLTAAFYFILAAASFIVLVWYVKAVGPANITINSAMFHLFRGLSIRTPWLNEVMLDFTILGQKQVILPIVIVVFAWLLIWKRWRAALHALALGVLAAGSVFVIKHLVQTPRPWGILQSSETFSMPSGHTTLATTVYIGFAFLIANSFPRSLRWPIYTVVIIFTMLVGLSRLYLGAHWFTDILSGWLLSASLLMLIIISYQRRPERPLDPVGLILVCVFALSMTFSLYHHLHAKKLKHNYTLLAWPRTSMNMENWWQTNNSLAAYQTSLIGFPSHQINLVWAGSLTDIQNSLVNDGWSNPPARDWVSTLHRLTDISSTGYLPMISPQYLDQRPALILVKRNHNKIRLVLRLWDANRYIAESNTPVWVGFISTVPRSYSWIFKKNADDLNIKPSLIFSKTKSNDWDWKLIRMNLKTPAGEIVKQSILLVRDKKEIRIKK